MKKDTQTQTLCAQIKTNGEQCEAFRLTDDRFCYFHSRDRQRQLVIDQHRRQRVIRLNAGFSAAECHRHNGFNDDFFNESSAAVLGALELPLLEDANAIQVTATNIMRLIAHQLIDRKQAALMLYALQIVAGILKNLRSEPSSYRPCATSDQEPLRELAAMLADLRNKKKAAASASATSVAPETSEEAPQLEASPELEAGDAEMEESKTGTEG